VTPDAGRDGSPLLRARRGLSLLLVLPLALLAACAPPADPGASRSPAAAPAPPAPAGEQAAACRRLPAQAAGTVTRPVELAAGACDEVLVDTAVGDLLDLRVDQRGVDVVVRLFDPAGRPLAEVDTPFAAWSEEVVFAVAAAPGAHRLRIEAFPGDAGAYALGIAPSRPASAADRAAASAHRRLAAADAARSAGRRDEAAAGYEDVRRRAADLADPFLAGEAEHRLALLAVNARRPLEAAPLAAAAAERYAAAGTLPRRAMALTLRGRALFEAGHLAAARGAFDEALRLYRGPLADDLAGTAVLLHNLGHAWQLDGYPQQAIESYTTAIRLAGATGEAGTEAQSRHNLGVLLLVLERTDDAAAELSLAARRWKELGDASQEAAALDKLGIVLLQRGDPGSVRHLRSVLARRDRGGDAAGWAVTAAQLGLAWWRRGEPLAAVGAYRSSLAALGMAPQSAPGGVAAAAPMKLLRAQAAALRNLAALESSLGAAATAADRQRLALGLYERLDDPAGRAAVLADLSRSRRRLGAPETALALALESLEHFESHRTRPADPGLRTDWFATVQGHYSSTVDLLLDLHRIDSAAGHDAAAFAVAERSRARSLLDLRLEADGGRASRGSTRPLGADDVSRRLVTPGTAILEYGLGDEASHLWLLDAAGLVTWDLPPRRELERLSERVRSLLALSHRGEARRAAEAALCEASRRLLSPAAARLAGADRLVVVGDGALAALPFAALPEPGRPCPGAAPLLAARVVTQPPSATLAALRAGGEAPMRRAGPSTDVAVFADAVYAVDDPRLAGRATADGARPAPSRLGGSAREAAAVATAAGSGATLHLGFAARPSAVAAAARRHRILHLAVHAVADEARPEASALLLSRWDAAGRAQDGDLTAAEVLALDVTAELVVLSACRTGLGRQVRGEGMLGLGRAFLAAGAGAVLVSLWDVGDAATAELMARFYRHLLAGAAAPEALATAQRELAAAGAPPAHWAGFVLQG
jgi:CHAT domain-containing protein